MAYDDAFLAITLHIDYRIDMDTFFVLLELLHTNLHRIRYLFIVIEQNLLTDDFRNKETGRLIRQLILVKIGRAFRQQILYALKQYVYSELILSRNRQNLCVRQKGMPLGHNIIK